MQVDAVLAYLDKITRFDRQQFTPLYIGKERLGWVNAAWKERLLNSESQLFEEQYQKLHCRLDGSYRSISHALAKRRGAGSRQAGSMAGAMKTSPPSVTMGPRILSWSGPPSVRWA
ncbi:hypothetical protein JOS77_07885 [Chromobacterium haemolyticum]|nr:hypothetical protein JOS77_07885 [Chromobacterium haemolyticum]